ncbi:MAG: hybrid sensor histidine kinase/response regulator [Anaerolineales bacterium]|nr:hybrid sensor histidine kinase/response regulator [Anaerolineales bacterium]
METSGKILIVDDEVGIHRGVQRALEPQGYSIETATTIEEGLQKIRQAKFDLVLLDVMLPDGRGIDLVAPAHADDPNLVIVIITGYATVELAVDAIKQGAYDFIAKPFSADMLLLTVRQGMEKRQLLLEAQRLQAIEQEAALLTIEKESAEKLSEFKSTFTLMIAHELRSPVSAAQSLLRTLIHGLAGTVSEKQGKILTRIDARMDELMALINDLLDLASSKTLADEPSLTSMSLQAALQASIDRFCIQAEHKNITISYHIPETPLEILATPDSLERILGNLISNAIKYTLEGGSVEVSMQLVADEVEICVADSGIGIPQAALKKLGEEFYRAENAKQSGITGTGLGLSIVKQNIDYLRGRMQIHSVEGQGTIFRVYFPLAKA